MLDRPDDVRGKPSSVPAIQGSGKLGARALRWEKRVSPSRAARRNGAASDAAASDIFPGWTTAPNGRQFYVRQLHDAKIKPLVETFDADMLDVYAQACGWVLARAHAKASEISATISGYLGSANDTFDVAIGKFALAYADQAEHIMPRLRPR